MSITFFSKGTEELNLSNSNAYAMLAELEPHIEPDCCGTWTRPRMLAIQQRLLVLRNTRNSLAAESTTDTKPGYCTVVFCGRTDEYVETRLYQFAELIADALARNDEINFG